MRQHAAQLSDSVNVTIIVIPVPQCVRDGTSTLADPHVDMYACFLNHGSDVDANIGYI